MIQTLTGLRQISRENTQRYISVQCNVRGRDVGTFVEEAQQARVWMASPTTMMAVLTTSRAVLKDAATRKQVHLIQEHLVALSRDFERFQIRMDKLATHIGQANKDVGDVQVSARKITSRFTKIEKVELEEEDAVGSFLEEN